MKISEINIYPIKSLGGISLKESIVEKRGLEFDRRWMLVDENNDFLTQREFPKMATVSVKVLENHLKVSAENFGSQKISFNFGGSEKLEVRIWRNQCLAQVADEEISGWFSNVLQTDCRLVFMPEGTEREINQNFNKGGEIVSFADGYPLLLIGENSLSKLNERLEKKIPMNRFRPNLVVEDSEGFAEDFWNRIKIGNTIFRVTKPCARCVIPTIDQKTGVSDVREPLKTLASFRKASDVYPENLQDYELDQNSVLFGQNLVAENFGEFVNIGDKLEILD